MPASSHEHSCRDRSVHDPSLAAAFDGGNRRAVHYSRPGSPKEVIVELTPADAVADRAAVPDERIPIAADDADAKPVNRLKRPAAPVVVDVQVQVFDDLRRDPAGAHLVAGKGRA